MRAAIFNGVNDIRLGEVPKPVAGIGEAVIRISLTTICGTDLHILRGEYPVKPGLVVGHEPVGVIHELGPGVTGYEIGERVLVGAITPCGVCRACLSAQWSQCGHAEGYEADVDRLLDDRAQWQHERDELFRGLARVTPRR